MKKITFTGELLTGHKDHAVEVPFDPVKTWNIPRNHFGAVAKVTQFSEA